MARWLTDRRLLIPALLAMFVSSVLPAIAGVSRRSDSWSPALTPASGEQRTIGLELSNADYEVDVYGSTAVGVLVQHFRNPSDVALEVAYVVGAPSGLHVTGVQIDDRTFDPAGSESPRVELEPGGSVTVRCRFQLRLRLADGQFRLQLPPVRGSRTGERAGGAPSGSAVPGAIRVVVHHGDAVLEAQSGSHELLIAYEGDRTVVELAERTAASRRFSLQLAFGGGDDATLLGYAGPERDGRRDVLLVLAPDASPAVETVRPKQVLFVVDVSGSMARGKLDLARDALLACLNKLGGQDRLNAFKFNSRTEGLADEPIEVGAGGIDRAISWLHGLHAGGGTELLPALATAFAQPQSDTHHPMIVLLTDGAITDEEEVLSLLQRELGQYRLFVVGIGENVKQDSILRLAEHGRGTAAFSRDPASLEVAMGELFDSVSQPLLWDLAVDAGGAEIELVEPRELPDLYAGRSVTVHLRVRGELPEEIGLSGTTMSGRREFRSRLAPADERDGAALTLPQRRRASPKGGVRGR